jgi:hypothetical protein
MATAVSPAISAVKFQTWPLFLCTQKKTSELPLGPISNAGRLSANRTPRRITSIEILPSVYLVDFIGSSLHNGGQ